MTIRRAVTVLVIAAGVVALASLVLELLHQGANATLGGADSQRAGWLLTSIALTEAGVVGVLAILSIAVRRVRQFVSTRLWLAIVWGFSVFDIVLVGVTGSIP